MGISKVIVNGVTKIDITPTTAAPADVAQTKVFFGADGEQKTGTSSGGGGGTEEKQVNFIDYDGTLLHSYTKAEFLALSALPANPTHTGLTSQGWNWTKQQITDQLTAVPDGPVWVGQMYITSDGTTQIDVELDEVTLHPYLGIGINGTVTVDWGDNSTTSTITGKNLNTRQWADHTYATAGTYTIRLTVTSGSFKFYTANSSYGSVLNYTNTFNTAQSYSTAVLAVRIGNGTTIIDNSAFANCPYLESITIPSTISSVSAYAFSKCYRLASLTLPSGITTISNNVLAYCSSLASVSLPYSVGSMSTYIFQYCRLLRSVTMPHNITSIPDHTFYYCKSLERVAFPSAATEIQTYAFSNCSNLSHVDIPSSVVSIGGYAFYACDMLKSLTLPDGLQSIGQNAFSACNALREIVIPSSVTTIGAAAFSSCERIRSITIPAGITTINKLMFYNCTLLEHVSLPSDVTSLGEGVFSTCYSLLSVDIPSGVTSINARTFESCYALRSVTIPAGVTSLGSTALSTLYSCREIHFLPTTPPTAAASSAFSSLNRTCIIYVPTGTLSAYTSATNYPSASTYTYVEE